GGGAGQRGIWPGNTGWGGGGHVIVCQRIRAGQCRLRYNRIVMVTLNRIYTRSGDDGTTSLGTNERRKKYDLRVAAYGSLDEVNAVIGVARLHTIKNREFDAVLAHIQNDLFDVE